MGQHSVRSRHGLEFSEGKTCRVWLLFFLQNPDLDKRHLRTQELLYLRLTWQVQILWHWVGFFALSWIVKYVKLYGMQCCKPSDKMKAMWTTHLSARLGRIWLRPFMLRRSLTFPGWGFWVFLAPHCYSDVFARQMFLHASGYKPSSMMLEWDWRYFVVVLYVAVFLHVLCDTVWIVLWPRKASVRRGCIRFYSCPFVMASTAVVWHPYANKIESGWVRFVPGAFMSSNPTMQ